MFEKVERALTELKGDPPKSSFSPYKLWIKNFAFIAIGMSAVFFVIKYGIEGIFGRATYFAIVNIDLIIFLQIIIIAILVEMRLHQVSIHSRL